MIGANSRVVEGQSERRDGKGGEEDREGAGNSGNPRGKGEAITLGHEGPLIRLLRALPSWPDPSRPQHQPAFLSLPKRESRYRGHQAYKSVGTTLVNNLFPPLFLSRASSQLHMPLRPMFS